MVQIFENDSVAHFFMQMEFIVTNMEETVDFTVFDSDMFSPNGKSTTIHNMNALLFNAFLTL